MTEITLKQIPKEEVQPGQYYLVKLSSWVISGQMYDVDYCRREGKSDGGGIGWLKWYAHNIDSVYELPGGDE